MMFDNEDMKKEFRKCLQAGEESRSFVAQRCYDNFVKKFGESPELTRKIFLSARLGFEPAWKILGRKAPPIRIPQFNAWNLYVKEFDKIQVVIFCAFASKLLLEFYEDEFNETAPRDAVIFATNWLSNHGAKDDLIREYLALKDNLIAVTQRVQFNKSATGAVRVAHCAARAVVTEYIQDVMALASMNTGMACSAADRSDKYHDLLMCWSKIALEYPVREIISTD